MHDERTYINRKEYRKRRRSRYRATASRSIFLRLVSWSSNPKVSAPRFEPAVVDGADAFKGFDRLSGFVFGFRGFIFSAGVEAAAMGATAGFTENERTTFSEPSSRLSPSSAGEASGEPVVSVSSFARSICSAMSIRSRCSSDVVERSFFMAASCLASAFGLLSIQAMNHPFSVSSTLAIPARPRYLQNSVRVTHRVEFIC